MNEITSVSANGYPGTTGMTGATGSQPITFGPTGHSSSLSGPMGPISSTGPTGPIGMGPTGTTNPSTSSSTLFASSTGTVAFTSSNFDTVDTLSTPSPIQYDWVRRVGLNASATNRGVQCVDNLGNLFVAITVNSATVTIYKLDTVTPDTTFQLGDTHQFAAPESFLVKFSPFGDLLWFVRFGGLDVTNSVEVLKTDNNNDLYVVGQFSAPFVSFFEPVAFYQPDTTTVHTSIQNRGNTDVTVFKLSGSTGLYQWSIGVGSNDADNNFFVGMVFDSQNNMYTTVECNAQIFIYGTDGTTVQTTVTHRPDPATPGTSQTDCILLKYDAHGNFKWVMPFNAMNADTVFGLATDYYNGSDYLYLTGSYPSGSPFSIYFANNTTIQTTLSSNTGGNEAYLLQLKIDASGNPIFQWATEILSTAADVGLDVIVDQNHNVYVTTVSGNVTKANVVFGGQTVTSLILENNVIAILAFDVFGSFIRVVSLETKNPASTTNASGTFLFIDPEGNIYTQEQMNNSGATNLTIYGADPTHIITILPTIPITTEIYVIKRDYNGNFQWINRFGNANNDFATMFVDKRQNFYLSTGDAGPISAFNIYQTGSNSVLTSITNDATISTFQNNLILKFRQYNTLYLQPGTISDTQKIITNSTSSRMYVDCSYYTTVYASGQVVNSIQLTSTGSNAVLYWDPAQNAWYYSHGIGNKIIT